jgi:hypothetical protein
MERRKFFCTPGNPLGCQTVMARLDRAIFLSGGEGAMETVLRWQGMARSRRAMTYAQAALVIQIEKSSPRQLHSRVFRTVCFANHG